MKASVLAKKLLELNEATGNDLDVYYSELIGDGKDIAINSLAYNRCMVTLSNEEEYADEGGEDEEV